MNIFDLTRVTFFPYMCLYSYLNSYFTYKFLVQCTWFCWDALILPVYILPKIYELKTYKRKEDKKNKFSNTNLCTISFYFVLMRREELRIYVFHILMAGGLFLWAKHFVEKEFVYLVGILNSCFFRFVISIGSSCFNAITIIFNILDISCPLLSTYLGSLLFSVLFFLLFLLFGKK